MRKIVLGLSLFSAFIPLTGMGDDKALVGDRDPNEPNDPSLCDGTPGNLVMNCGFETGAFAPWVQSGDPSGTSITTDSVHTGNWGLLAGPVNDLGFITQNITTTPGGTYALHMWLAHLEGSDLRNRFQVSWGGTVIADASALPQSPYTEYCFQDLPSSGTSTPLRIGYFEFPSFFEVDDIVVQVQ